MEKKKRIVAVDDSSMVLKALEMLLSEEYEFFGFTKGTRALKYLKDVAVLPDLIILDVDMPEIDGYEMIRMIKSKYNLKNIPVIFLTSNGSKEYRGGSQGLRGKADRERYTAVEGP